MENATKITKAMVLTAIKANVENMEFAGDVTAADVTAYCDKTLEQLANKAAKAKEKAAEKKVEGDELRDVVESVLTDEVQTIADIAAQIDGEDVTVAKITYRLTALVKAGIAAKEEVAIKGDGKTRKVMGYKLAATADAE